MKLSVVIPVYNAENFIDRSYRSIIDQQLDDFEIIYVNNNSEDKSVEHIENLMSLDSRIKLLHQSKQGAAPARNLGIMNAIGDYIYVFDVDDEIYPAALNHMIGVLDTHEAIDAVFGKMIKSNEPLAKTKKPTDESFEVILRSRPFWGIRWFSNLESVVGPPAFLYRKRTFEIVGFYNENLKIGQDTALDIKLGMLCNIAFLDMYVYMYYKHSSSTIEQSKRKMDRSFMMWPRLTCEHLPFYLANQHEKEFGSLLIRKLFSAMGRQIYFTKGFNNRKFLKKKLLSEAGPIEVPDLIYFALSVLVLIPNANLLKVYGYYILPYAIKKYDI